MMDKRPETFNELLMLYKNSTFSLRQLITYSKRHFQDDVIRLTDFLDDSKDVIERLYYIINDIHEPVKCKICGKPASWTGRINEGYHDTCGDKACISTLLNNIKAGSTKVSSDRDKAFIERQSKVFNVNDDVINDLFKYDKFVELVTNEAIIAYLDQRYEDSYSRLETVQRIKGGVEEKPKCPVCGKPVKWVGKKNKMFTTYCSEKCAANDSLVKDKKAQKRLENWGTKSCYNSEKYKALCKERYGVEYHFQRKDIIAKRKETLMKNYGTTKLYQVESIKQKIIETTLRNYGTPCYFQSLECREKMNTAMKLNSLHGSSKAEDMIYGYLKDLGYEPVRSYFTEDFPYSCDFYIEELDLRIEYQGSQYHNKRAYLNNAEDQEELKRLDEKDKAYCKEHNAKKSQYRSIMNTWSIYDVKKRKEAYEKHIRYLEIYDCESKEDLLYQIGLYLHALNKQNFYAYPKEELYDEFKKYLNMHETELRRGRSSNKITKQFQCCNFFKHEMELYAENPILRRKLIQNRMLYLNKKENELTPDDLLTGFKKSGIFYGYSHFNPEWANWFVHKYGIRRIYDPCGGWGHHALGMLQCEKIVYNDYSPSTADGVREMKKFFSIDNLEIHCKDAARFEPEDVDAFFMCPPYYNLEHYECGDFSDIWAYEKFLNSIFTIWHKNTARVFGMILREDLIKYVKDKPVESFPLNVQKSHLSNGTKLREIFYIFEK